MRTDKAFFSPQLPDIRSQACLISNSLSIGIACGIGFNKIEHFVQTDAEANPGSSGGAPLNADGLIIGMMSGIFTKNTDTDIGVNFAVYSDLILRIVSEFLK